MTYLSSKVGSLCVARDKKVGLSKVVALDESIHELTFALVSS